MKLYVLNRDNQKVYLNVTAPSRPELQLKIGARFLVGNQSYIVNEVYAEVDRSNTTAGAIVGGVVGALAGPMGIIIGGFLGGLIGNGSDREELAKVERFNRS